MIWTDFGEFRGYFDPWEEFERVRRAFTKAATPSSSDFPAVNLWVSGDNAIVTTEIPGVDPKTAEISVAGKTLTLKGARVSEELGEGEAYHRRERWYGHFSKTFDLPFTVETEKVKASFAKGVLNIELPRAEAEKPKKIEIKSE
jgi:HSP20 family protein